MEEQETIQEIKTDKQFQKILSDSNDDGKLIIIDFYADWCGPCKAISPYIEILANTHPDIHFYKINVSNKKISDTCLACEVKNIPAFCYFKNGKYITTVVGANKEKINDNISKYEYDEKEKGRKTNQSISNQKIA